MLVIVSGLQGTGKTAVAKRIAAKLHAALLRTDVLRKTLVDIPQYTEEEKQRVYDEMFSRAQKLLHENRDVVLDATFIKQRNRDQAKKIAEQARTDFKIVEIICPEDIIRNRIAGRMQDESEAGFEQYLKNKRLFEQIMQEHIIIDNSGTLDDIDAQLENTFEVYATEPVGGDRF